MGKAELRIEIDETLLRQAKAAGLDIGDVATKAVTSALQARSQTLTPEQWEEVNRVAIEAHRKRLEKYGVFGDDLRTW